VIPDREPGMCTSPKQVFFCVNRLSSALHSLVSRMESSKYTFQVASTQFLVYGEADHLVLFREDGTQCIQAQEVPHDNTTFFIRDLEPGFQERLQLHKVDGTVWVTRS
jgi:hypothetical protein